MDANVERKLLAKFNNDEGNVSTLHQNPLNSWLSQALTHMHKSISFSIHLANCSQRTSKNISRKRVLIQLEQLELLTLFT